MRFAIYKGETSIKDLVSRLFRLPDKSAKMLKQASDALLQANPELANPNKVQVGAMIKVPDGAPPLQPGEEVASNNLLQQGIARQAQQRLQILAQRLAEIDERAATGADALLALAKSKKTQALMKKFPELKEQTQGLISSAQAVTKSLKAQVRSRSAAMDDLHSSMQPSQPKV